MKGKLVVLLALMAVSLEGRSRREGIPSACPPVDPLPHTIHLPHPSDCTLFLRCDHGVAKPERCPARLHFNRFLQVCDWPQNAGCLTQGSEVYDKEWGDVDNESQKTPPIDVRVDDPISTSDFVPEDSIQYDEVNEGKLTTEEEVKDDDIFNASAV